MGDLEPPNLIFCFCAYDAYDVSSRACILIIVKPHKRKARGSKSCESIHARKNDDKIRATSEKKSKS